MTDDTVCRDGKLLADGSECPECRARMGTDVQPIGSGIEPLSDELLAELDRRVEVRARVDWSTSLEPEEYLALRERLRRAEQQLSLAEAVVEAAATAMREARDADRQVFDSTDAEWLSGCTTADRALLDAINAYRDYVARAEHHRAATKGE